MLGWEVIPRIPIGGLSVSPHGIGIAVGYFLGATLMARRARKIGFNEDHAWNAAVVGVLGAIVGARVAYIVGHRDQFSSAIEYLQIYKGGISLMGGLIGGFLAAYVYCRINKVDFLQLADLGAPGLAIGTAVGRIGDLIIGDHLGKTTDGFWGWEYKGGELISSPPCDTAVYPSPTGCIEPGMVVHQTALYDSVWSLVIFFILMWVGRKPRPKGFLVLTWAALYSLGRILTDLTRVDKTWFGTGLTGSQLTAIVVFLFSAFWLMRLRRARPEADTVPAETAPVEAEPLKIVAEPAHTEAAKAGPEPATATEDDAPTEAAVGLAEAAPEAAVGLAETAPETAEPAGTEAVPPSVEAPVPTPQAPADEVPPVETPATAPVEAFVLSEGAVAPLEEIPPAAEEGPPEPVSMAADEANSPPEDEHVVVVEEVLVETEPEEAPPAAEPPATEVLVTPDSDEDPSGSDEAEPRRDSQEP